MGEMSMTWMDETHTILRVDTQGKISWAEYHAGIQRVALELEKTSERIDILFNDTVGMPPGNPLPHLRTGTTKLAAHANFGKIYTVSINQLSAPVKIIVNILMRVYQIDGRYVGGFFTTIDTAMQRIQADRLKENQASRR
jgi:hypothetical protein